MERCDVHDQKSNYGVHVLDNGQAMIEICSIRTTGLAGICVARGGRPHFRNSKVFDGRDTGILMHEHQSASMSGAC